MAATLSEAVDGDDAVLDGRRHTSSEADCADKLGYDGKKADLRHGQGSGSDRSFVARSVIATIGRPACIDRYMYSLAYELATSFAPLPNAEKTKAMVVMAKIQSYLAVSSDGMVG
jgi:hypothetical protein